MKGIRLMTLVGMLAIGLATAGPTGAVTTGAANGEWHRNNYNAGEEVLTCHEGPPSWACTYGVPETVGWFSGRNVTESWTCPEWFPSTICDNVVAVYHGRAVYVPSGGTTSARSFLVDEEYVITEVAGQAVLQLYWVDRFVCPWYRTLDEALAADFNCVFAP